MCWATFWATFSQTHLVTLIEGLVAFVKIVFGKKTALHRYVVVPTLNMPNANMPAVEMSTSILLNVNALTGQIVCVIKC
jgi:hypothetical protein